jgi:hypothetical protein
MLHSSATTLGRSPRVGSRHSVTTTASRQKRHNPARNPWAN